MPRSVTQPVISLITELQTSSPNRFISIRLYGGNGIVNMAVHATMAFTLAIGCMISSPRSTKHIWNRKVFFHDSESLASSWTRTPKPQEAEAIGLLSLIPPTSPGTLVAPAKTVVRPVPTEVSALFNEDDTCLSGIEYEGSFGRISDRLK